MAEYPSIVLTNAGLDMIAESQTGRSLIFTKLKIGDGLLGEGESISTLTALKSPKLDIPIQGFENQENGQVRLRYLVDNTGVAANQGFFAREVGVYAKLGETGTEKLYAYTNGGNKVDWIPDKNTPMDAQIFDVFVLIGNAQNVTVIINSSATYATVLDLSEHNDDENVHGKAFENHNADLTAHPSLLQSITSAVDKISKKGNGIGRNMLITGPKDENGNPIALYSDLASGDITLKAGTKLTFADGLDDSAAPKDYPVNVLSDATKTLAAADQYTIPIRYTPDFCAGGTAISGGDLSEHPKANAFDGNDSTYWSSSQSSTAITNTACLGVVFATAKDIRRVRVLQGVNDTQSITTAELQYSLDGITNWTKAADVTLNKIAVNGSRETIVTIPYIANAKGWRLMARSSCSLNWTIYTIELMEALQTHYLYADYLDGVISLVSSKNAPQRGIFDATATYAADTYFYDVETGQSKHYDGTSWKNVTRVYLGSADVDSSGKIVAVNCEPYNLPRIRVRDAEDVNEPVTLKQIEAWPGTRLWVSGEYTPVADTPTIVTHNLNIEDVTKARVDVLLKCAVATAGYSVGEYACSWGIGYHYNNDNDGSHPPIPTLTANTVQLNTGNVGIYLQNKAGGLVFQSALSNWRYIFRIWY